MLSNPYFLTCFVIVSAAVITVFSDSWLPYVKKLFEVPGALLLLPLSVASFYVLKSPLWLLCFVNAVWVGQLWLGYLCHYTDARLPHWLLIISMTGISCLPTVLAWSMAKPFRPFRPPYWISVALCLMLGIIATAL